MTCPRTQSVSGRAREGTSSPFLLQAISAPKAKSSVPFLTRPSPSYQGPYDQAEPSLESLMCLAEDPTAPGSHWALN